MCIDLCQTLIKWLMYCIGQLLASGILKDININLSAGPSGEIHVVILLVEACLIRFVAHGGHM